MVQRQVEIVINDLEHCHRSCGFKNGHRCKLVADRIERDMDNELFFRHYKCKNASDHGVIAGGY
jgi:hypothetical protein